jgi:conjugative transfer pilus assembly protein TraH
MLILVSFASVLAGSEFMPARASWVDDWFDQKTGTSAGYYEGQKRGYYTAGGFSGRVKLSTDPVFTVMPPKLRAGCGGIDAFWGGFGFLNFDYLVQKVQRILQAAPAAAFDIALNVLCTPCAQTIKSLEAIANQLNSIQLDDCKAGQAIAAYAMTPFADTEAKQRKLSKVQADFLQSTGARDLWKSITEEAQAAGNAWTKKFDTEPDENPVGACTPVVKMLFVNEGYMLDKVGRQIGMDGDFIAMARGLIGDVFIYPVNGITVVPHPGCSENNLEKAAQAMSTGDIYVRTVDASGNLNPCVKYAGVPLKDKIRARMNNIASRIKSRAALDPLDEEFLNNTPFALGLVLKHAVMMRLEAQMIQDVPDLGSRIYAYFFLADVLSNVDYAIATAEKAAASEKTGASANECMIDMLIDSQHSIQEMRRRAETVSAKMRSEYGSIMAEANTITNWMSRHQSFADLAYDDLRKRFGMAVANRAMGYW